MDDADGSRLITLHGSEARGRAVAALSCVYDGKGSAPCECEQVHVTANIVDLAAYRVARRQKLAAGAINLSLPASENASTSFASIVWAALMFPLLWTAYWTSASPIAFLRPPEFGN